MQLLPSSSQLRNALAYMLLTSLALLFLNVYSAATTRSLMFRAKQSSAQDKLQMVSAAFSGADSLSRETVDQVIAVLGDLNVTRLLITDAAGCALYDSAQTQNAAGSFPLFQEIVSALNGNDAFRCVYDAGTLKSFAATPILMQGTVCGCVYILDYDVAQGGVIAGLERTILRGSLLLLGVIVVFAVFFSVTGSGRMRKILTSMRLVREGEYSHKIQLRGSDEFSKLATEFNQLTDKLQASEAAQRQFVSDASHELKTPLASIKLLSDSILQNEMDADTMREFVSDIGQEADRLTRMTQKLLTLSRTESAQASASHEIVDLGDTVSSVFRLLIPLADAQQVRLTASGDRFCTVLAYEDDVYQIIFNLVENAVKYNHPGGSVHVTVRITGEDIQLQVQDTGVGIPAEAQQYIFDRFYRVDKARSRQAGGSGLGLSIVREMVERNDGRIRVESREGEGSCFTVIFPAFRLEGGEAYEA